MIKIQVKILANNSLAPQTTKREPNKICTIFCMSQFSFVTGEKSTTHFLPRLRIEPATLRINTLPCRHNRVLYT